MKFTSVALISLLSALSVKAADSDDVAFLTNLVADYKSHTKDYAKFIRTASSVPAVISSLALEVGTYTDDSYTTLLDDDGLDIDSLEDFATELPWYSSRLANVDSGSETDSGSDSSSTASSDSSSKSSSSSEDYAGTLVAPVGALVAGLAVILL